MAGLLTPLFRRRRRAVADGYYDYLAMSYRQEPPELEPRRYRWVVGREDDFADPISRIIAVLLRDAIGQNVGELTFASGPFRTRVLFGEGQDERLTLPRFHAPLLLLRLRGLCGLQSVGGSYPQQGSFAVVAGKNRYGVLVTITMTPWGEQATLNLAVAP